jgi:hypothetical protein
MVTQGYYILFVLNGSGVPWLDQCPHPIRQEIVMHLNQIRPYLENLAQQNQGNPLGYLWEFSRVHIWWHGERMQGTQLIGFLTFHKMAIQTFGSTFPNGGIPVQPSPLLSFPGFLSNPQSFVDTVQELQIYSNDIEAWHNQVHTAIGGRFGDAALNIGMPEFWAFHLFIDSQFDNALQGLNWGFEDYLLNTTEQQQRLI